MSLLEWLGESHNPGPTGGVEFGGANRSARRRLDVLLRGLAAVLIVVGMWWTLAYFLWPPTLKFVGIVLGVTLAYLLLGYFVHPRPDTQNLGWFGGLMDHPLRYSDDMNRSLLMLQVLLWPGRFVAECLADLGSLIRYELARRLI